jgi:hypothetical protein
MGARGGLLGDTEGGWLLILCPSLKGAPLMTPLRTRMIRELELRRKARGTVSSYVKAVEELARH